MFADVCTSNNVIGDFLWESVKVPLCYSYFEHNKFNKLAQGKRAILARLSMVSNNAFFGISVYYLNLKLYNNMCVFLLIVHVIIF